MNAALQTLIDRYEPVTPRDWENALREIVQELALLGLWRSKFFEHDAIGRHAAAGNTYWNLASKSNVQMPEGFGPSMLNFVGVKMRSRGKSSPDGLWVESIRPGSITPPDLYQAMLQRRLGEHMPALAMESPAPAAAQSWKSADGRVIKAQFGGLKDEQVTLIRAGQTFVGPLAKLAPERQAVARQMTAGGRAQ